MAFRFRLAALQIEDLSKCHSWAEIKKCLDYPPKTLFEMYSQILSRLNSGEHDDAVSILRWLAFSAQNLNLAQLNEVLVMKFNSGSGEPYVDPVFRYEDPQEIFRVCSGLIVGSKGNVPTSLNFGLSVLTGGVDKVKLAHVTVKEYLISVESKLDISERDSHALISKACLAYLLRFDALDSEDGWIPNFPLLDTPHSIGSPMSNLQVKIVQTVSCRA